jgi:hypothetical protein
MAAAGTLRSVVQESPAFAGSFSEGIGSGYTEPANSAWYTPVADTSVTPRTFPPTPSRSVVTRNPAPFSSTLATVSEISVVVLRACTSYTHFAPGRVG